jgi:hypothetical protein
MSAPSTPYTAVLGWKRLSTVTGPDGPEFPVSRQPELITP